MPEKAQVVVAGLDVGPNDLTKAAGTLLWADNVVHRRNGTLEPLEEPQLMADVDAPPAGKQVLSVFADWQAPFFAAVEASDDSPKLRFSDESTAYDTLTLGTAQKELRFTAGRTFAAESNGRFLVTGAIVGPTIAVDDQPPAIVGAPHLHSLPRPAGITPPVSISVTSAGSGANGLTPIIQTGDLYSYCVVFRRTVTSGQITSAPSVKVRNVSFVTSGGVVPDVRASWGSEQDVRSGDQVVFFRTKKATSADAINDTYYKVKEFTLRAGDVNAGFVYFYDQLADDELGEELYTNPGQQGSLQANLPPPLSRSVTTFKDTTFYVSSKTAPAVSLTLSGKFDSTTSTKFGTYTFPGTSSGFTITPSSSSELANVSVGQKVYMSASSLTSAARVTAVGPSSFTVNEQPFTSGTQSVTTEDVLLVEALRGNTVVRQGEFTAEPFGDFFTAAKQFQNLKVELNRPVVQQGEQDGQTVNFSALLPGYYDSLRVTATNAKNWNITEAAGRSGTVTSPSTTAKNLLWFSKAGEPEHVPPVNYLQVGSGECYRAVALENSVVVFCSDGIFRVNGSGNQWAVSQISKTDVLMHPDAVDVFENIAWAWVEHGLAAVTEQAVDVVSEDAIGPAVEAATLSASFRDYLRQSFGTFVRVDRINHEVRWQMSNPVSNEVAFSYIFNVRTKMWTQIRPFSDAEKAWSGSYSPTHRAFIEGRSDGYYLQEPGFYRQSTIVYNPFTSPQAGLVKEWVDLNWFIDNLESTDGQPLVIHFLYGGDTSFNLESRTELDLERARPVNTLTLEPADMRRAFSTHSLVPRRAGRSVELVTGLDMPGNCYYQLKGSALQFRPASKSIKRQ